MSDALFWDKQYRDNRTFWDIGAVSPPLEAYFQQLSDKNISILIPGCGNAYEASWLLEHGFSNLTLIDISPILTSRLHEKFASLSFSSSSTSLPPSLSIDSSRPPASLTPPLPFDSSVSTTQSLLLDSSASLKSTPSRAPALSSDPSTPPASLPSTFRILTGDFFLLEKQFDLIIEQTFFCALPPSFRPAYAEKMYRLLHPGGKLVGLLFDRDFPSGPPYGGHASEYQQLFEKKFTIKTLSPCYNSIPPRAGSELFLIAQKPDRYPASQ